MRVVALNMKRRINRDYACTVRLLKTFLKAYFMEIEEEDGPELRSHLPNLQKQAAKMQAKRVELMGELLRSKGFVWIATCHNVMGEWQQVR